MALSSEDRSLRLTLIGTFLVALGFLIPYGVHSDMLPPFCLIPAGLSAFTSIYHLSGLARHAKFNILLDLILAPALLTMYIASTVRISQRWRLGVLGTYGTIPVLLAFFIHIYFVVRDTHILEIVRFRMNALVRSPQCPHCQRAVLSSWGMTSSQAPSSSRSSRHSYMVVNTPPEDEDEVPADERLTDYKDAPPIDDVDETTQLV